MIRWYYVLFVFFFVTLTHAQPAPSGQHILPQGCFPHQVTSCFRYGFNTTSFPNFLGESNIQTSTSQMDAIFAQITSCSIPERLSKPVGCSIYIPLCQESRPMQCGKNLPPCQEDCIAVIQTCLAGMLIQPDALALCRTFPTILTAQQTGCGCINTGAMRFLQQSNRQ